MPQKTTFSSPSRERLPIILIRGFGGLSVEDEKSLTYQGFNDGTVYPLKSGENYIYEGLILRFMKSGWGYRDATNVVGYYPRTVTRNRTVPPELEEVDAGFFSGDKTIIDPSMALSLIKHKEGARPTLWVFRYYDLNDRAFVSYGHALVRLIDFVRALNALNTGEKPKVNIIAHSMGGLIVREAVQRSYPNRGLSADDHINKIVTLGTPHKGISFQILREWINIAAEDEVEHFSPEFQKDPIEESSYVNFKDHFPLERLLTVVGTNYRSYEVRAASMLNRLFSISGEFGANYNRSDGLVKQDSAQIPGAPRTFVHKCHGGADSLVTSREAFEIATRFFFGDYRVRLRLKEGKVIRGLDFFGKSEIFFGFSVKPRGVDFDLFHQSAEAENCYGPFYNPDLTDEKPAFDWAGPGRLIWEGFLDTTQIMADPNRRVKDMVMRCDFYVGERDLFGIGFSDNVIFRKQYYARILLQSPFTLFLHTNEQFAAPGFQPSESEEMEPVDGGWEFKIGGTGFDGILRVEIERLPDVGTPMPFESERA